jgi:hypothetical protein
MPLRAKPHHTRLERQFRWLERTTPAARGPLKVLRTRGARLIRVPLAVALILGGFLAILPFLGLWMLPVGLLLLAIDIPALRPLVANTIVRVRRRISLWTRRYRGRNRR